MNIQAIFKASTHFLVESNFIDQHPEQMGALLSWVIQSSLATNENNTPQLRRQRTVILEAAIQVMYSTPNVQVALNILEALLALDVSSQDVSTCSPTQNILQEVVLYLIRNSNKKTPFHDALRQRALEVFSEMKDETYQQRIQSILKSEAGWLPFF
jgi:hypothetical protein